MHQPQISYKSLRKLSPETARTAVLQYLSTNNGNISGTAGVFGVTRATVYDILRREDLKDRSKAPKRVANKTSMEITLRITKSRKRTGYGAKRLRKYLYKRYKIIIPVSTIKGILNRST